MYIGFPGPDDYAAVAGFAVDSLSSSLPGSGTNEVLNLTNTSNVNIPGVWMFQVGRYGKSNNKDSLIPPT